MAAKRLPRNTRQDPTRASWLIERAKKERFEQLADRAGVSAAVFLERVIEHIEEELTDRGVPEWWPAPESDPEELDMPPS